MNGVIVCLYGCYSYMSTNQYVFQKPTCQSFHEIQRLVKNGQLDCDPSWSRRKAGFSTHESTKDGGWCHFLCENHGIWLVTTRNFVTIVPRKPVRGGGLHLSWEYDKGLYHNLCRYLSSWLYTNIHVCWSNRPSNFSWSTLPFFWVKSPNPVA